MTVIPLLNEQNIQQKQEKGRRPKNRKEKTKTLNNNKKTFREEYKTNIKMRISFDCDFQEDNLRDEICRFLTVSLVFAGKIT